MGKIYIALSLTTNDIDQIHPYGFVVAQTSLARTGLAASIHNLKKYGLNISLFQLSAHPPTPRHLSLKKAGNIEVGALQPWNRLACIHCGLLPHQPARFCPSPENILLQPDLASIIQDDNLWSPSCIEGKWKYLSPEFGDAVSGVLCAWE